MIKRILFLSYYYTPDLGPGAFRNTALVGSILKEIQEDTILDVMTTMPNRYQSFSDEVPAHFDSGSLRLHRFTVPQHTNGFWKQIKSFLSYRKQVLQATKATHYDLVFASSSKLFTAHLAFQIAKKKRLPLYIDLRDLFAENIRELIKWPFIAYPLSWILKIFFEKPCLKYATHINVNSEGFLKSLDYIKHGRISFFPNGIDDLFLNVPPSQTAQSNIKIVCYAGNIGEGQGLDKIIPPLALKLGSGFLFYIIGAGNTKQKLIDALNNLNIQNVKLISPVKRAELMQYYQQAHYLFLHLNDFEAFRKVLPSKLFEYGAMDKPILAGVAGYAKEFIEKHIQSNYFVFEPCDWKSAYHYLVNDHYQVMTRPAFISKFRRETISDQMAKSILFYVPKNGI